MINMNDLHLKDKRILLVDDEEDILNILETVLVKEGFQNIYKAKTGQEAIEQAQTIDPALIVLDIMLPDIDGYDVCQRIRKYTYAPILFLSAKADDVDKLLGLGMGGDDYITKPFSPKEVAYRIKAQFRRMEYMNHSVDEKMNFGEIVIDQEKGEVRNADELISLTALEYQLLIFLTRHPHQILSKESITENIWGIDFDGNDNAIMVHIHHLRQKIEENPADPKHILTARGLGYKFNPGEGS